MFCWWVGLGFEAGNFGRVSEEKIKVRKNAARDAQFQKDFSKLDKIVRQNNNKLTDFKKKSFLPNKTIAVGKPLEDQLLHDQQMMLSNILETSKNYLEVRDRLAASLLANTAWEVENWEPIMIDTAFQIVQKWKHGFTEKQPVS